MRHFLAQAIGAYKFSTLSSMKEYESVNKSLKILGCKSIEKVLKYLRPPSLVL